MILTLRHQGFTSANLTERPDFQGPRLFCVSVIDTGKDLELKQCVSCIFGIGLWAGIFGKTEQGGNIVCKLWHCMQIPTRRASAGELWTACQASGAARS